MDKATAVATVADRVGRRTDLNAEIAREMQLIQETRLERGDLPMPWFLLTENSWIDTVSGEQRLPLPSDFLREYEPGALWYYDADGDVPWTPLRKDIEKFLREELGGNLTLTGQPTHYSLTGDYFRLYPVPDGAYRIYMKYFAQDTDITVLNDTLENQWLKYAPDLLIAETTLKVARNLRMRSQAIREFETDIDMARRRFHIDLEARKHTNMRYVMGGDTY